MSILHRAELVIFADYHQFYVQDGGIDPDAPTEWTEEDVKRRVKEANNVVVLCPVRNSDTRVDIEVRSGEPHFGRDAFDHLVLASLELPTGYLQVHECTGGEKLKLSVSPGWYRVLFRGAKLGEGSENGLDGNDFYQVILWPAIPGPLVVLKQWTEHA